MELAKEKGFEFTDADPQSYYPDDLDVSSRKWKRTVGIVVKTTKSSLSLLCTKPSTATIRAELPRSVSSPTCRLLRISEGASGMSLEEAAAFKHAKADAIVAPESGTLLWEIGGDGECVKSIEPFIGKEYKEGDFFCYIENMHGQIVEIPAALGGKLVEINAKQGAR